MLRIFRHLFTGGCAQHAHISGSDLLCAYCKRRLGFTYTPPGKAMRVFLFPKAQRAAQHLPPTIRQHL